MRVEEIIPTQQFKAIENGTVCCTAPSNIALVKYWGKKPHQIPANPSITLQTTKCVILPRRFILKYSHGFTPLKQFIGGCII
jgi:diphosphomevalonate decarboxylase